jgi:hypothetical protein
MPVGRALARAIGLAVAVTLSGCAGIGFREEPGISYAKSVRQLGIYPVYPPREDLQVGDIYGVENTKDVENVKRHSVFVDSVNLTHQIRDYLDGRYTFADTTNASKGTDTIIGEGVRIPDQSDAKTGEEVLQFSNLDVLPITGFPVIEVDSGLAIGVQGAAQSLAAVFGFAAAKTLKMKLQFGAVTSYSIPIPTAFKELRKYCAITARGLREECNPERLRKYIDQKYQLKSGATKWAIPLMVSKVYLARAISYTFNDKELAQAAAAAAGGEGQTAPNTLNGELLKVAVSEQNADLVKALAEFQTALNQTKAGDANGISVSMASYSENSVTFKEIYQRPVVVGYEAVYFDPFTEPLDGATIK